MHALTSGGIDRDTNSSTSRQCLGDVEPKRNVKIKPQQTAHYTEVRIPALTASKGYKATNGSLACF